MQSATATVFYEQNDTKSTPSTSPLGLSGSSTGTRAPGTIATTSTRVPTSSRGSVVLARPPPYPPRGPRAGATNVVPPSLRDFYAMGGGSAGGVNPYSENSGDRVYEAKKAALEKVEATKGVFLYIIAW